MMRLRGLFQRLQSRRNSGTAMVEFSIIAPAFFLILFAIVETGMSFFANNVLENGALQVARLIRTGQAQNQSMTQSQIFTQLCNQVSVMLSCDTTKLQLDVRAYSSFASTAFANPITAQKTLDSTLNQYAPGGPCSIVVVRAFYVWPLYTPMFSTYFSNLTNNNRLLTASFAFRNEPYGSTTC